MTFITPESDCPLRQGRLSRAQGTNIIELEYGITELSCMPETVNATLNEVLKTIRARRAVRKYLDESVSEELIQEIIEAGRNAPSAMNRQPWNFIVLTDKSRIRRLSREIATLAQKFFHLLEGIDLEKSEDMIFHGAPVVILITSKDDSEWIPFDIGMCAQNILLAAKSLGLGSCPIGLAKWAEQTTLGPELEIPPGHKIQIGVVLGYSAEEPPSQPRKRANMRFLYWE